MCLSKPEQTRLSNSLGTHPSTTGLMSLSPRPVCFPSVFTIAEEGKSFHLPPSKVEPTLGADDPPATHCQDMWVLGSPLTQPPHGTKPPLALPGINCSAFPLVFWFPRPVQVPRLNFKDLSGHTWCSSPGPLTNHCPFALCAPDLRVSLCFV